MNQPSPHTKEQSEDQPEDKHTFTPTILITGVSSGIGQSTARYLVNQGYRVFGSVRRQDDAASLQSELGSNFTPLIFDVSDSVAVVQAIGTMAQELDSTPLAGLINNAGIAALGPMECLDDDQFEQSLRVNVIGTRYVINACLPLLRGKTGTAMAAQYKPGKIINISSLSGIINTPVSGAYCVSKHAVESLGEIYRRELLPQGIDVVSIRSGPVASEIWNKNQSDNIASCADCLYDNMIAKAGKIIQDAQRHAIPATVIATLIDEILKGKKRKTHYELGRGATLSKLLRHLPDRWVDRMIVRSMSNP